MNLKKHLEESITFLAPLLSRFVHRYVPWSLIDALIVAASLILAWRVRSIGTSLDAQPAALFGLLAVFTNCSVNYIFRIYHRIWKYASGSEAVVIGASVATSTALLAILNLPMPNPRPVPLSVIPLAGFFAFVGFVGVRYRRRVWTGLLWRWRAMLGTFPSPRTRVLLAGAGEGGQLLALRFLNQKEGEHYHLLGFVDDDKAKHGMRIHGLPILGSRDDIPRIVEECRVELVVIAINRISGTDFRAILEICESTSAAIKVIPNVFDLLQSANGLPSIRNLIAEDLLGREPVGIDQEACQRLLSGKRVLVTGAAGSIGSELCRQIAGFGPSLLLMVDNNESGLFDVVQMLERLPRNNGSHQSVRVFGTGWQGQSPPNPSISPPTSLHSALFDHGHLHQPSGTVQPLKSIIADITNATKMEEVFALGRPNLVFHAAAYKHVPLMEEHPDEAVRVNILGTKIVAGLAAAHGAERFVFVSTDKAINPSSVMGATKRIGEMLITHAGPNPTNLAILSSRAGHPRPTSSPSTLFTAVRFGNVLRSRGSVVPTFERQIDQGGPVTVTHPNMTRYLITIPEAVSLIIQAAAMTEGDDIFMLDMGQGVRIDDLARRLIRIRGLRPDIDIPIVYTGPRPGEKIYEDLLGEGEVRLSTTHPHIFRIRANGVADALTTLQLIDELIHLAQYKGAGALKDRLRQIVRADDGQKPHIKSDDFGTPVPALRFEIINDGPQHLEYPGDTLPADDNAGLSRGL